MRHTTKKKAEAAERTQGYIDMGRKAGLWLLGLLVVFFLLKRRRRRDDETTVEATASDLPGAAEGVVIPADAQEILLAHKFIDFILDPHVAAEHQVPQFAIDQRLGLVSMKLDRAGEALAAFDAGIDGARAAGNRLFEQACGFGAMILILSLLAAAAWPWVTQAAPVPGFLLALAMAAGSIGAMSSSCGTCQGSAPLAR